jgi:hypothetical protein
MTIPTRAVVATLALLASGLAGCLTDAKPHSPLDPSEPEDLPVSVLLNALEPMELTAPIMKKLKPVATANGGEPGVWVDTKGLIYATFPGCPVGKSCINGPVYRSEDEGATWMYLNNPANGSLDSKKARPANGDSDVATDAAGKVYASDLGGGIQVFASDDGFDWSWKFNVVPQGHWADRQWMAAAKPGELIVTWMGGASQAERQVAVRSTFDGGDTWTDVSYFGDNIGWLGTVQFNANGTEAYIPYTQTDNTLSDVAGLLANPRIHMMVLRSLDGGRSWESIDTGVSFLRSMSGLHWSGVLMAPALDVTGDGHVVVAWAQDDSTAVATSIGAPVRLIASADKGKTWSQPVTVSARVTNIFPWVTAGAGDRVAVTYFTSDTRLDSDYAPDASWDVEAVVVDGVGSASPTMVRTTIDTAVHTGGLCARGGLCGLTASNRRLLDFFESDVMPDGRLIVVYPADNGVSNGVEMRVALQEGGSPLLIPGLLGKGTKGL